MDFQIFHLINNFAQKSAILDLLALFIAKYLIWLLFFVVIVLGLLPPSKRGETLSKVNALKSILGALLGAGFTLVIGQFVERPRPFIESDARLLISPPIIAASFPSLHTTLAFAFGWTLFLFNRKIGTYFLIAALLLGLSRIYTGVHYPSDILFGALLGCFSAYLIKKLTPSLLKRKG